MLVLVVLLNGLSLCDILLEWRCLKVSASVIHFLSRYSLTLCRVHLIDLSLRSVSHTGMGAPLLRSITVYTSISLRGCLSPRILIWTLRLAVGKFEMFVHMFGVVLGVVVKYLRLIKLLQYTLHLDLLDVVD